MRRSLTHLSDIVTPASSAPFQKDLADKTFQSSPQAEEGELDDASASALSVWVKQVVDGDIKVPAGLERGQQLARDLDTLSLARVCITAFTFLDMYNSLT